MKAKFTTKRRTTFFPCIGVPGHAKPHISRGVLHTRNNNGPLCGHCVRLQHETETGEFTDELTGLKYRA